MIALSATILVILALVVVELPTINEAISARLATRDEMNELVLVELTETRPTKSPFVAEKLLVKKFVELLFVMNELRAEKLVAVALSALRLVT